MSRRFGSKVVRLGLVAAVGIAGVAVANVGSRASAAPLPAAVSPGSPAAVGGLVWAAARARATGRPVVADALTTQTRQVVCNPDGSQTVSTAARPVRVKKNGSWQRLSAVLGKNGDGSYTPAAALNPLVLSGGGPGAAVAMSGPGGNSLSLSWPGILPTPTLAGDSATYASVLPGVDLVVRATTDGGFSQVLVVKDAAAAANPALARLQMGLSAPGLTVRADAAGNLAATDSSGADVFLAPAPLMWDSTSANDVSGAARAQAEQALASGQGPAASSASGPGVAAVISPVAAAVAGSSLTLVAPASGLVGPTVRYPVFIDPNWTPVSRARQDWTYVNSYYSSTNYFDAADVARVGYQGWTTPYFTARSFYLFTIPTQIWGTHISSATLQTYETWSASGTAYTVNVNHISTSPTAISSATTWTNQPVKGPQVASVSAAGNWSSAGESGVTPKEIDFDVTGEIISAASGHWSYDTLGLYNSTETDRNAWRKFQNNPTIAITYNTAPNAPSAVGTSPVPASGMIGNTAVTFSATGSDPDGTQNPLTMTFTITDTTANTVTTVTQTVSSGQVASFQEPASFFPDQHTYTWSVKASDGIDTGPTTAGQTFTMSKTAPHPPAITAPAGNPVALRSNVTFTLSDTGQNPTSYFWGLNLTPPAVPPVGTTALAGWTKATAAANGATTSATVKFLRPGTNIIYAYAVDAVGNPSSIVYLSISVAGLTTPDKLGDFTGDGLPDLLQVGPASEPGLWLFPGTDTAGHVAATGTQIGTLGTGFAGSHGNPTDWNGASITDGDFTGDGVQDILIRFPTPNPAGSNLEVLPGTGDGLTFDPTNPSAIDLGDPSGQGDIAPTAIAAAPDNQYDPGVWANLQIMPLPDIYAVVGQTLQLYTPNLPVVTYDDPTQIGTSGWGSKDLTGAGTSTGPDLFARDTTTGALDRWAGTNYNTTTGAPGIPAAATGSTHYTYATSGWSNTTYPTLTATDINNDGATDLLATTTTGANAYLHNSNTTFNPATTTNPLIYAAPLADCSVPITAPVNAGTSTLRPQLLLDGGGAAWAKTAGDITMGSWTQESSTGIARFAAGGNVQMILDSKGVVWAKGIIGNGGWTQETQGCNIAIAVGSSGVQLLLDGAGSVWAQNTIGNAWTQETPAGEKAIAVGGSTQMILDGGGAIWAKATIGNGGWTQETQTGNKAIAVSSSGVQLLLDGAGSVWAQNTIGNAWTQETPAGEKAIAVGGSTQMILDGAGAIWAKASIGNGGWTQETPAGETKIAIGSQGEQLLLDGAGAVWGKNSIGNGGWAQESPGGETDIAVG